jgi:gliding motility-associated transport system permease protein
MSTSTTPEPNPPASGPIRIGGAPPEALREMPLVETAPSAMLVEGPTFARGVGFAGLFFFVLGLVVVISTRMLGPRWVPEGFGFLAAALGLALMLYHAVTDSEQEIRRLYGLGAAILLIFALAVGLLPGPTPFQADTDNRVGFFLLPWGIGIAFISLLFAIPFTRHETDDRYRNVALMTLLTVGGALAAGSVVAGVFQPDFLAGPGLALALLGLGFLCAYLAQVDTSEGIGYLTAFAVGAFGAVVLVYAVFRASLPQLLYDGPAVLRKPNGALDYWKVAFRVIAGLAFLAPALIALASRAKAWLKGALGLLGLAGAGAVVLSMINNPVHSAPQPFLVPGGLILMFGGLIYLAVALGICSDNQFVTLTRRELSSYFLSPIGYLVLGGMVLIHWNQYRVFLSTLARAGQADIAIPEPIVGLLFIDFLPVIAILLQVPALTMRLVAEEKRTGSMEVLLTAPVNEWPVILSKFLATWFFFLLTWIPAGLFLIALRLEVGQPFDYRPLLSFYVCLAAQGLAFVGMGVFFSTVTKNQIVAAVLTFVGMLLFFLCFLIRREQLSLGLPPFLQNALGRLSFVTMWIEALAGRLPLRDCLLFASLGVFWLFLSVKVLETRKWN